MDQRKNNLFISICFICLMLSACLFSGCSGNPSGTTRNSPPKVVNAPEEVNYDTTMTGIVRDYNVDAKFITVYDITNKQELKLDYTGGTQLYNLYDQPIVMSQVTLGEIVDLYYYGQSQKLTELRISKEAWTYKGVANLTINKTDYRMKISQQNYWYDEGLTLFSDNQPIDLIDLGTKDILTVKGLDSQVCSIMVTTGHGYIRLKNYADFIGGTLEVGYGIIVPIVEDMLIVAQEGSYNVILENGELVGTQDITLKRNEEVVVDMSAYYIEKERIGYVRFDLDPYGADLYINDTLVDYSDPIKLNYGRHEIRVTMTGYDEFNGILTIGESTPTICISLAEGTAQVVDNSGGDISGGDTSDGDTSETTGGETITDIVEVDDTDTTDDTDPSNSTGVIDGTTSVDNDHTITIESPAGATLYLNGKRLGTLPLSFTKEIGNHIFVLSQAGYLTKSYSVEVIDDGENVVLNFPSMILSE